jgi:hypothetical protein
MSTGPSSSTEPYIVPTAPNVRLMSIVTTGDPLPGDGVFGGKPDGIAAFDNGDGTMTVLVAHQFHTDWGLVRDHGSTGSYVDRLIVDKATLEILSSSDLIQSVRLWNDSTNSYYTHTTQFEQVPAGYLAPVTAFYNPATGLGSQERILMVLEEYDSEDRAFATLVTGPNAGVAYELPYFGNMKFENAVGNPLPQDKTVLAITDDTMGGQIYVYIGQKQSSGSDIQKAGLSGGDLYGVRVAGFTSESVGAPVHGTFTLQAIGPGGDVSNMSGSQIESASDALGVTGFLRPEDAAWDPDHPNVLYFDTTDTFTGNSRLYKLTFTDISHPELGGTIEAVLDGSEGQRMFDSIDIAAGKIILAEDPGDQAYVSKIWQYDIASDTLMPIASFDPAQFTPGASGYITDHEESSGILDVTSILGDSDTRAYLLDAQVHKYTGDPATVQMGQLLVMYVDQVPQVKLTFTTAVDTILRQDSPGSSYGAASTLQIDGNEGAEAQGLLAFTDLFGDGPGQIPVGSTITSAILTVDTVNASTAGASLHRMLSDWTESSTWNSLGSGVQLGREAVGTTDLNSFAVATGPHSFDVTSSLVAWLSGATSALAANQANNGWLLLANTSDGWGFLSSESGNRPSLTVTFIPPPPPPGEQVTTTFAPGTLSAIVQDTSLFQNDPDRWWGGESRLYTDLDSGAHAQTLLEFGGMFGDGPGQVPIGATILSASLTLTTVNPSTTGASLYRMLVDWTDAATWDSLGDGVQPGAEATLLPDLDIAAIALGTSSFDVTASVQAWLSGALTAADANEANNGWLLVSNTTNGWDFESFESSSPPILSVTYALPGSAVTATSLQVGTAAVPAPDRADPSASAVPAAAAGPADAGEPAFHLHEINSMHWSNGDYLI